MENIYDVLVVGGGPAGMTAALYALRNGRKTAIIEKMVFGGQIVNSPKVENIPGFDQISGEEFGDRMLEQVNRQGADIVMDEVVNVTRHDDLFTVELDMDGPMEARTVILATGTVHRTLGLDNEEALIGKSVHFCAVCDGSFYKDKPVVMIGGGNSAFVDANYLADVCSKVIILQDMDHFTAEQKLQEQVLSRSNVETHVSTKILEYVMEDGRLTGVRYEQQGQEKTAACDGVFLAVGLIPDNERFASLAVLDERGYFATDESGLTATPGLFVAGDCRSKSLRQVATACSDGANAAIKACIYLQ